MFKYLYNNMKNFFNSYRVIFLLSMIGFVGSGILHYYKILSIKEYYVIFGLIFFLSIIAYLINYISDINKEKISLIQFNIISNKALGDSIFINNYLLNMCMKAYELVDNIEWKYAWSEFVKSHTKTKDNNDKKEISLNLMENLQKDLKYFERQEDFERCGEILKKIKQLENNKS